MKNVAPLVFAMALGGSCSSAFEATGTLLAAHPPGTMAVATSALGERTEAPVADDGTFTLRLPTVRGCLVRFVAAGKHARVMATVMRKGTHRPLVIYAGARSKEIGQVGTSAQALVENEGGACDSLGTALDSNGDADDHGDDDEGGDDAFAGCGEQGESGNFDGEHQNVDADLGCPSACDDSQTNP